MRFVSARRIMVGLCWLAISAVALTWPVLLLVWPVSGLAFLVAMFGSLTDLGTAASFRELLSIAKRRAWALKALLALLACCSIAGAIAAVVPSMALRSSHDVTRVYGLSVLVAPVLWAAMLGTSISALAAPSPRRLVLVAVTGIVSWPLLLAIRVLREPLLDLYDHHLVLAPWALRLHVVAVVIASGIAIAIAFVAARMVSGPVVQLPPRASALPPASPS